MDKKLRDLLYSSFDSNLFPEEKKFLEQALSQSKELKQEKEMISSLRKDIKRSKITSFQPYFADRVMENIRSSKQIDESEQFFESLFVFFRPIAITAAVLIIIIAGYNITTTGHLSIEGALGIPEVTVADVYDPTLALVTEE
jgi:CRISPR/Cas system CMR subunit Cmr6 (Cas7 group RAMP superfamily)